MADNENTIKKESKTKEPPDITEFFMKAFSDNKELIAAVIVFIGILISVGYYVYMKGYYSFFQIDDRWINIGSTNFYYKLVIPLCGSILLVSPNFVSALPFIFKRDRFIAVWYEILLFVIPCIIFACVYWKMSISYYLLVIISLVVLALLLCSLSNNMNESIICLGALSLSAIISIIVILSIVHCHVDVLRFVTYAVLYSTIWFTSFGLSIFIYLTNKPSRKSDDNDENINNIESESTINDERIENAEDDSNAENNKIANACDETDDIKIKNKIFVIFAVIAIFVYSLLMMILYFDGYSKAVSQKSFKIIFLEEREFQSTTILDDRIEYLNNYDELLSSYSGDKTQLKSNIIEKYKEYPFIQYVRLDESDSNEVLRKVINAYIVISSDDENSLILNGYIDEDMNLYCFYYEKKVIETKNLMINDIKFSNVIRG